MTDPERTVRPASSIKRHGLFVLVVAEAILAAVLLGYVLSGFLL
jgi:hypothetical protein